MRHTHIILAGILIFVMGCATTPDSLEEARAAYAEAEQSTAPTDAPAELREAKKALERAEAAFAQSGDRDLAMSLAYVAQRKAQRAAIAAQTFAARQELESKEETLLRQNELARKALSSRLDEASQYAMMTTQQLRNEREKLEQAQAQLSEERAAGEITEDELAEKQMRLAEMAAKLEEERIARAKAQADLAETKAELEKVASIKEEAKRMVITINGSVLFELDKAQLRPIAKRRLDQVADVLLAERGAEIMVEGHTDSQGPKTYNETLSTKRASAVRDYLVSKGVAADRIKAIGKGESNPIAPNDTPEGRANNRRVEIVVERPSEEEAASL